MSHPTKAHMKKWIKVQEQKIKEFKISVQDFHNLYDLMYMINWQDYKTVKLNKMDKWLGKFFERVEDICLDESTESASFTSTKSREDK